MHAWLQGFRYALRTLRKNLGLTLVIVASLAIGIGANSAILSVMNALLLRPLPYPRPGRPANIRLHSPGIGIFRDWPSPGEFIDLRTESHSFDEMALAQNRAPAKVVEQQPRRSGALACFGSPCSQIPDVEPEEFRQPLARNTPSRHSCLNAAIGSSLAARLAGTKHANIAAALSSNTTPAKATGSVPGT